jgi:predicted nucleotidyltransferase
VVAPNMNHMVQKRDSLELEIINQLVKSNNHVRGLAKILQESHSTISRILKKLTKENVVDFKQEGKNKKFFLKESPLTKSYILKGELHKLSTLLKNYPTMNIIIEDILNKTNEKLIILFGSYAKFNAKKGSDIDIYIETKDRKVKKQVEEINSKINVKIGPFDKKSPLIKEIIEDHIIIRGLEDFYERKKNKLNLTEVKHNDKRSN